MTRRIFRNWHVGISYLRYQYAHMWEDIIDECSDLAIPRRCGGCKKRGYVVCPDCRQELEVPPQMVFPPIDIRCPVFAVGPYSGPWRNLLLEVKVRARYDLIPYMGALYKASVEYLTQAGWMGKNWAVVPAPSSARAIRKRGCDIVTELALHAGWEPQKIVKHAGKVQDSEGLSAGERRRNLQGKIMLVDCAPPRVLLIDDVITTGATLSATADVLRAAGAEIIAAIGFCGA